MGEKFENTHKFTGKADVYQQFRPGYPDALYEYLCKYYVPSGGAVADVGAGTGKFAEGFIRRNITTYCVEPNEDMARVLKGNFAGSTFFRYVNSPAENIGLPPASVDLVTAAQAFHWFDGEAFRACCKRILKEGGTVALVWNKRDRDEAEQALYALDVKYCPPHFMGRSGGIFNDDKSALDEFFNGYEELRFENGAFSYNRGEFIGRRLSSSYALKDGDDGYEEYVEALGAHFDKYATFGKYVEHITTYLYIGRI